MALVDKEQPQLIILGKQAIDDDSNQTGRTLAALTNSAASGVCLELSSLTATQPFLAKGMAVVASNLVPVNMELGDKDPLVVTAEADLEEAASWIAGRCSSRVSRSDCQVARQVFKGVRNQPDKSWSRAWVDAYPMANLIDHFKDRVPWMSDS